MPRLGHAPIGVNQTATLQQGRVELATKAPGVGPGSGFSPGSLGGRIWRFPSWRIGKSFGDLAGTRGV